MQRVMASTRAAVARSIGSKTPCGVGALAGAALGVGLRMSATSSAVVVCVSDVCAAAERQYHV